jgi:hypothetical protein
MSFSELSKLSNDSIFEIMKHLPVYDLINMCIANPKNKMCEDEQLWKYKWYNDFPTAIVDPKHTFKKNYKDKIKNIMAELFTFVDMSCYDYPNNAGEISLVKFDHLHTFNIHKLDEASDYNYEFGYRYKIVPYFWIGEKSLYHKEQVTMYKNKNLLVTNAVNINDTVESGKATDLTLKEAKDLVSKLSADGYRSVNAFLTSEQFNQLNKLGFVTIV